MQLFLIRHAETVANVAQVLAGSTDSPLTNHGAVQIERLAQHFKTEGIHFTRIYCSDLTRAAQTAAGICIQQPAPTTLEPVSIPALRERHFGSLEGHWTAFEQPVNPENPPESAESVTSRANSFINDHLLPVILDDRRGKEVVAVVSHGITLGFLWRAILELFDPRGVILPPDIRGADAGGMALRPGWTNTGFMQLDISLSGPMSHGDDGRDAASYPLSGWSLQVRKVNSRAHLAGLRRVPGIGSAVYDQRQQRIDGFFKS
ncbi:hypothetical protein FE257_008496 [Aspergillus nanangensis]|uniref:Phosphoglycerate mutase family protein n=1 Tax=Aspergillus nanangensis TaxID=2582783 RepID=A0AAD4CL61_ASPNN|nr:hypothetical protein FE257_008496 [Aspergillus nanangensis]